ncbi:MAG TPA: hypothetical protein VH020_00735 [Stellaceae bacterium]|nr:hypothetical protein [Stellaceae bacterium]
MRFWLAILLLTGLTACAADKDDPRYQFGVSGDRPAAATPGNNTAVALLDWKATQICTLGYRLVRQDTMNTEGGRQQIVDNHLHCNDYHPSFDPSSLSWDMF